MTEIDRVAQEAAEKLKRLAVEAAAELDRAAAEQEASRGAAERERQQQEKDRRIAEGVTVRASREAVRRQIWSHWLMMRAVLMRLRARPCSGP